MLNTPDNIFKYWIGSFSRDHSHCIKFGSDVSDFLNILVSIIQGCAVWPASYVNSHRFRSAPITTGNQMDKYADDTMTPSNQHQIANLVPLKSLILRTGPSKIVSSWTEPSPSRSSSSRHAAGELQLSHHRQSSDSNESKPSRCLALQSS
jgi:hypothetical protein